MIDILIHTSQFVVTLFMGYFCKKIGLLTQDDGKVLSTIILNLTLPAVLIAGLNGAALTQTIFHMILFGLGANLLSVLIGQWVYRKENATNQAFMMLSQGGYNIGNFVIPFIQSFLPPAVPLLVGFDIGNALMIFGGRPLMVDYAIQHEDHQFSMKAVARKLLTSPAFVVYLFMLPLMGLGWQLPEGIMKSVNMFASANSFLAMFMLGLFLNFDFPKASLANIKHILSVKYLTGFIFAGIVYFLLPLDETVKLTLVILAISPVATASTIQMLEYEVSPAAASFLSSVSILISLVLITLTLMVLG